MRACGDKSYTAVLLGAANYFRKTQKFNSTAVVIFRPAEEYGGGAEAMVSDGMMTPLGI